MTLQEILENFKQQQQDLSKAIREGSEQLEILKERLLRVSGAVEGIQLAIDTTDNSSAEVSEDVEVAATEVLPE